MRDSALLQVIQHAAGCVEVLRLEARQRIADGALIVFRTSTAPALGTGMLAAADGMWRLRPLASSCDVPRVEVSPCSGAELRALVEQVIRSATAA